MAPEEQDQVKTGKSLRERGADAVGGLLVGVILMVIGILFVNRESSQLSYTIEGPIAYLDTEAVDGVVIEVDGEPVENIYGYRVRLWNSGTKALENVPVDFEFQDVPEDFRILNVVYGTTPEFEHRQGVITQTAIMTDTSYVQLQYALLDDENSQFYDLVRVGHEDNVAFVTTAASDLEVNAILLDMRLTEVEPDTRGGESMDRLAYIAMAAIITFVAAGIFGRLMMSLSLWMARQRGYYGVKPKAGDVGGEQEDGSS